MRGTLAPLMVVASALAGCAAGPEAPIPVVTFPGVTIAEVQNRLVARCMSRGSQVDVRPNGVICYRDPTEDMGAVGAATLRVLGGGQLLRVVTFTMARQGPDVVVQARSWLQSEGSFGQVRRTEHTDFETRDYLRRAMLEEAGRPRG